jgi:hypothetical protein
MSYLCEHGTGRQRHEGKAPEGRLAVMRQALTLS